MRPLIVIAVAFLFGGSAAAGELTIAAGLESGASTWKDDTAGYGTLDVGYRWQRWSVFALGKSGYAEVDERILQYIGVGGAVWTEWKGTRPFFRLAITHQHESPRDAVDNDIGTLLGYGSGIRHRGGVGAAGGLQYAFREREWGHLFASAEAYGDAMIGSSGPTWYWGGGLAVGFTYDFGSKK